MRRSPVPGEAGGDGDPDLAVALALGAALAVHAWGAHRDRLDVLGPAALVGAGLGAGVVLLGCRRLLPSSGLPPGAVRVAVVLVGLSAPLLEAAVVDPSALAALAAVLGAGALALRGAGARPGPGVMATLALTLALPWVDQAGALARDLVVQVLGRAPHLLVGLAGLRLLAPPGRGLACVFLALGVPLALASGAALPLVLPLAALGLATLAARLAGRGPEPLVAGGLSLGWAAWMSSRLLAHPALGSWRGALARAGDPVLVDLAFRHGPDWTPWVPWPGPSGPGPETLLALSLLALLWAQGAWLLRLARGRSAAGGPALLGVLLIGHGWLGGALVGARSGFDEDPLARTLEVGRPPTQARAMLARARTLAESGRRAAAEVLCRRAVDADPDLLEAWVAWAAWVEGRAPGEARALAARGLERAAMGGSGFETVYMRSLLNRAAGRPEAAAADAATYARMARQRLEQLQATREDLEERP